MEGIELEVENRVRQKVSVLKAEHQKALQEVKNAYTNSSGSHNNLHINNNNHSYNNYH